MTGDDLQLRPEVQPNLEHYSISFSESPAWAWCPEPETRGTMFNTRKYATSTQFESWISSIGLMIKPLV